MIKREREKINTFLQYVIGLIRQMINNTQINIYIYITIGQGYRIKIDMGPCQFWGYFIMWDSVIRR